MATAMDIDDLAHRLADRLRAMEADNVAPYETEPFDLSRGDISLMLKSLHLLEAVRISTN